MCGIIGIVDKRSASAVEKVIQGIELLEYRGYNGAGLGLIDEHGEFRTFKYPGKTSIRDLRYVFEQGLIPKTNVAMGHTRWATKGAPETRNCHPHVDGHHHVMLVHNGDLTNVDELRKQISAVEYLSDTDSEVMACHLATKHVMAPLDAIRICQSHWQGSYALIMQFDTDPGAFWILRNESPLLIGESDEHIVISSGVPGLLPFVDTYWSVPEATIIRVSQTGIQCFSLDGNALSQVDRQVVRVVPGQDDGTTGGLPHRMLREILEQPTLWRMVADEHRRQPLTTSLINQASSIEFIACGTSLHAALTCAQAFRETYRVPVTCFDANEYQPVAMKGVLTLAISQSGETADVLRAFKRALGVDRQVGCIVNDVQSQLARMSLQHNGLIVPVGAGLEKSVASTKAYTCQIIALKMLAAGKHQERAVAELVQTSLLANEWLQDHRDHAWDCYEEYFCQSGSLFLGHDELYPVALEGALKLKELAYVCAMGESCAGMKHGPLALLQPGFPVVFLAQSGTKLGLIKNNLEQLKSHSENGVRLLVITNDEELHREYGGILLPEFPSMFASIGFTLPLQLLAYYTTIRLGYDVDKPRNLAKTVTV